MQQRPNSRLPTILLVEDDPDDQDLTARALACSGVRVQLQVVGDGEEAMDYLLRQGRFSDPGAAPTPDLVLLDLNMPKVDGREVLRRMRAHEALKTLPVVVLTTSRQEEDVARSYQMGCSSFVTKPVGLDEFLAAMRTLATYWFELVSLPQTRHHP